MEDEKVKSAEEPAIVVTEAERAFFEKFEDIAVRLWSSEAARLQGNNFEAWGLNTARQHGWKGESSFEAWDYIDSALERSAELESQLAEVLTLAPLLDDEGKRELVKGGAHRDRALSGVQRRARRHGGAVAMIGEGERTM